MKEHKTTNAAAMSGSLSNAAAAEISEALRRLLGQTVLAIVNADTGPEDPARPGHSFPLRACRDGVMKRRGHAEAAVDLAGFAGLNPSGVICEIANDDGTMACLRDLIRFCRKYDLTVSVADLARYRILENA